MKRFGRIFRIGVATLASVGVLAAVPTSPAATTPEKSGVERLWEQFPLDATREPAQTRTGSPRDTFAPTTEEPRAPKPEPLQATKAAANGSGSRVALVLAIIALLAVGAVLTLASGSSSGWLHRSLSGRLQRPWPRPFARPTARAPIVLDLLRAASAATATGTSGESRAPRRKEQAPAPPRPRRAEAKPIMSGDPLKYSQPDAQPLKRKAASSAAALKTRKQEDQVRAKERLSSSDAVAKEKLARRPAQPHPAATVDEPPPRPEKKPRQPKPESALRPVPDPGAPESPAPARDPRLGPTDRRECETRWWRGYVKSEFLAIETRGGAATKPIARSPGFRWHKGEPPPETPEIAAALGALVRRLEHEGWTVAGRGEEWFSVKLRTSQSVPNPDTAGGRSNTG